MNPETAPRSVAKGSIAALLAGAGVVISVLAAGVGAATLGTRPVAVAHAATAPAIGFGATTVVDDQRIAGEPDVKVCGPNAAWEHGNCGLDNSYLSAPWGFSTTSSFVWRTEDHAKTFKLVPSNNTTGKPDACPGGGDTDLGVDPGTKQSSDYLNFIDLQALTNFSSGVSADGGQTWLCNPVAASATAVDRQWFGFDGPPHQAGSNVYFNYDITSGPTCTTGAGNEFVAQRSTDGGKTWLPFTVADCNDGIAGNIEVNQVNHHVFMIHTAFSNPKTPGPTTDEVAMNKSVDHGATWTRSVVYDCSSPCTVGQDFAVLAIDKAGGLYAVWSQAPVDASGNITGPSHIFYAYSSNEGGTWSAPRQVDSGTTDVNVFPWIAAGNKGAIDVVWYGTKKSAAAKSYSPSDQTSDWFPYMSQSLNANTASPTLSAPVAVAQHSNHNGGICTMGIGCTTGGDRSLADFFQVTIDRAGGADVTWADTSNNGSNGSNQGALIDEARQISGTTLFGTTLSGSLTTCTSAAVFCQPDQTGDAKYEANGMIGPNVPQLDITGSTIGSSLSPDRDPNLAVRMKVADLSTLPGPATPGINPSDRYIEYLTSWNYHIPGNTQADYDSTGNVYYAYLQVDRVTGAVTAFDGNTCSIATTHPKDLVYPGQHAISFTIDKADGVITLLVPRADVGNPPFGATLYSVTAHTAGEADTAGPFNCTARDPNGNNQDPHGQLFNVYDKSPAYTAKLTDDIP